MLARSGARLPSRRGRGTSLRPKSFDALRFLLENSGRLISKDEFIKTIWPNTVVSDDSLTSCVSDVRRAVGDLDQTVIKTVPRRGYIFTASVTVREPVDSQAAMKEALERALPEKPSLAVLPFTNMSCDPAQEYLSDGMTEDIITELTRFRDLFVIARNSSFQYKGKAVDIRQIGRELGVRYVLEGSIRRAGDSVRISAQLIDVQLGMHLWAERYDRRLEDAFAVQDEVARAIATVLVSHVTRAEQERTRLKPPSSWRAYDYCIQGFDLFVAFMTTYKRSELHAARQALQHAIELDPGYARAHAVLSNVEAVFWSHQVDSSYLDPVVLDRAARLSQKAVQLDPHLPQAYGSRILPLTWTHQHDAALAAIERALLLNPNFIDTRFVPGYLYAGAFDRCIECARTTMRFDPVRRQVLCDSLRLS